jgi:glycogen(starch) synthase
VWSYALELIQGLARQSDDTQYEVLLATLGMPLSPSQCRAVRGMCNLSVCESRYKLEWMDSPWNDVDASGEWLLEIAARFAPDLVHLNTYAHGTLPWNAPVVMVGHSCVCSWWQAVKQEPAPDSWRIYRERVAAGLHQADRVVAPTQAMMDALVRHYGPLPNAQVIHNGRNPEFFAPATKEPFLLTMGRAWDEAKNTAILDDVAPRLPWPIYLAGDLQRPHGTRQDLKHLRSLGQLDPVDAAVWLAKASIYVLPARYEPFGLSVLEAALSGCALVLGDIDSLRELWGEAATYVPSDNPDALVSTLEDLIRCRDRRELAGRRARERAIRYTDTRMAYGYHHLYQQLMDSTAASKTTVAAEGDGYLGQHIPMLAP